MTLCNVYANVCDVPDCLRQMHVLFKLTCCIDSTPQCGSKYFNVQLENRKFSEIMMNGIENVLNRHSFQGRPPYKALI